ncbi:MAG: adenylate/guanylate cyclase domain-containing protein, partial [Limnothrix sp. RL_2_0]|nr:adenylate/guanylate cyclase domain-containing protein [Limnothrix sp. RL_2_0]
MGLRTHHWAGILSRRISRRVAFWIFASIVAIEAIILVPSARRQEQELLRQLEDKTSIKVTWLMATWSGMELNGADLAPPEADADKVLQNLRAITQDSEDLNLLGGAIYDNQGKILASFGDRLVLDWPIIQAGKRTDKNEAEHYYEFTWTGSTMGKYTVVLRHDITMLQAELVQYKLRIAGLVLIISVFVTGSTMLVMQILVISPVLKLREDLQAAGELVSHAPEKISNTSFHSFHHHRNDELGDVMDAFHAMLDRTASEIQQRILAEQKVRKEQEKSDELLLNILPSSVANELKENRHYVAQGFDQVSILFADLVGFTALSTYKSPEEIVTLLNDVFSSFDRLSEVYNLEKIKTIGDAYMIAGGLPMPQPGHADCIADMAMEMQIEIERINLMQDHPLQLRIGIHCGSVVAGVIGTRKFIYDLWGDAVNVASRMESQGLPGMIQVTSDFKDQLGDRYIFEQREQIEVKGKGLMQTYFLVSK